MIIGVDKAQKEGHWIIDGHEEGASGYVYPIKTCSKCGFSHSLIIPDDYCPKCGSHNHGKYKLTMEK